MYYPRQIRKNSISTLTVGNRTRDPKHGIIMKTGANLMINVSLFASLGIAYANKTFSLLNKYCIDTFVHKIRSDKDSSIYVSQRECVNNVRCGDEVAR